MSNNEPITISDEARKAASELNTQDLAIIEHEMPWVEEVVQLAINSATAPLLKRIEELEKQLLAMREVVLMFKEATNTYGGHGTPIYRDRASAIYALNMAELNLNSTPADLSRKYVKREVLEKCVETLEFWLNAKVSYDSFGNCIVVNDDRLKLVEKVTETLTLARKELEK